MLKATPVASIGRWVLPPRVRTSGSRISTETRSPRSMNSTGSVLRVVSGDGLDGPDSICVLGNEIWVTNLYGDSVTELNARNGSRIRVIKSKSDGFSAPTGITSEGLTIWVTNQWSNTVT